MELLLLRAMISILSSLSKRFNFFSIQSFNKCNTPMCMISDISIVENMFLYFVFITIYRIFHKRASHLND